jgi:phenylpropionate dioxygenase-like ring-hydroxylating dioxygenase large terminal subunit
VFTFLNVAVIQTCITRTKKCSLATLSEGRVVPISGNIECPYHGWTFEGCTGKCTGIPQADPNATLFDLKSRGCATALRCHVQQGILWVHSSTLYQDKNKQSPNVSDILRYNIEPIDRPGVLHIDYFRDLPMEWSTLAENVLDPSHLPFTHHKTISSREKASPVLLRLTCPITAQGFQFNKTQGSVEFLAPHLIFSTTRRGENSFDDWNIVYAIPTLPGRCRLMVRVVFEVSAMKPPLKWIFSLAFRQPGFLLHLNNHKILEDDNIFLHYQGHNYRALESFEKGTYLPTRADAAVIAFQRWMKEYERERSWSLHTPPGAFLARDEVLPRDALIERKHAHTESCSVCLNARRRLEQADSVLGMGAIIFAIRAVGGNRVRWSAVLVAGIFYALKQKAGRMRGDMETGSWPPPRNK